MGKHDHDHDQTAAGERRRSLIKEAAERLLDRLDEEDIGLSDYWHRNEGNRPEIDGRQQAGSSAIDPWVRDSAPRDPLQGVRTYLGLVTEPEHASDGADPWSLPASRVYGVSLGAGISLGQPVYLYPGSDGLVWPSAPWSLSVPVLTSPYLPREPVVNPEPFLAPLAAPTAFRSLVCALGADCRRLWSSARIRLASRLARLRLALESACDCADIEYHLPRVVRVGFGARAVHADGQQNTYVTRDQAADYWTAYMMQGRVLMSPQAYESVKININPDTMAV